MPAEAGARAVSAAGPAQAAWPGRGRGAQAWAGRGRGQPRSWWAEAGSGRGESVAWAGPA